MQPTVSLGQKTIQSVFWYYFMSASGKLLAFISTIVMARLGLGPTQFGQVALAFLAITYLEAIGDLGVAAALIYERNNVERAAHVAFMISVASGIILWIAASLCAPLVANYFNEPLVAPMLRVLAFTLVIQALGNVHIALLSKELEFRRRMYPELARNMVKGVGSVIFVLLGFGAWSLIWGQMLGVIIGTIGLWLVLPWRPRWIWDLQLLKRITSYGFQILLIEMLAVVWATADYILVGRSLGKTDLGLYQTAFRISDLLIINICWVAGRVLFSTYAKLNDNPDALRNGYVNSLRFITSATFPISIGLAVIAPLCVNILFGQQWLAMTPVLQWLSIRAGIATLSFNSGHLLKAVGRPDLVSRIMTLKLTLLVVVLLITLQYGVIGVAIGQVIVATLSATLEISTIIHMITVAPRSIWHAIQPALLAGVLMGLVVWLFVTFAPISHPLPHLVIGIVLGIVSYACLLRFFDRRFAENISTVLQALRPVRASTLKHD